MLTTHEICPKCRPEATALRSRTWSIRGTHDSRGTHSHQPTSHQIIGLSWGIMGHLWSVISDRDCSEYQIAWNDFFADRNERDV